MVSLFFLCFFFGVDLDPPSFIEMLLFPPGKCEWVEPSHFSSGPFFVHRNHSFFQVLVRVAAFPDLAAGLASLPSRIHL